MLAFPAEGALAFHCSWRVLLIMSNVNHTLTSHLANTFRKSVTWNCHQALPGLTLWTGHGSQPGRCWSLVPHKRKSPASCDVHLEPGTPHPPCHPDLRPGGSDSTFGPCPLAAGVRRPRSVSHQPDSHFFLTLSILWPNRPPELFSLQVPAFACCLRIRMVRDFSPSTLLILVGQRKSLPQGQNHPHAEVTAAETGTHASNYSGVEAQDPLKLNRLLCITVRPE